ncbi:hypothetical protein FNYG_15803 [Fusarium nygamai]|uniref:Uncharacterized protein n=1 Tax=Gibberella nygamai TaxID=42673 RepID=A0A2K0U4K7_GIBNY|nr:hypothetical protein FNYG_15803 [Fusarium nygamai]
MLAHTALLSILAALAATSFAETGKEPEPYSVHLYEDDFCEKQVSSVGDNVPVNCEDLENQFNVPIRSFKFEHPDLNAWCGFSVSVSKEDNTCSGGNPYIYSGNCFSFNTEPGKPAPEIKSWSAGKNPCNEN